MKITPKGPAETDLTQLVQNDKKVASKRSDDEQATAKSGSSTSVNISPEARKLQRIAELAQKGDQLRAEKVKALKEQIERGEYQVDSQDVAQDILRSEVGRLLGKK